MTPRSLFTIILKTIGLIFLAISVFYIPTLFSLISFAFISQTNVDTSFNINFSLLLLIFVLGVFYLSILYLLFNKTDVIIDKLKLDKGFEQNEFTANISSTTIFTVIIVTYGGYILLDELPTIFKNAYSYYQERKFSTGLHSTNITLIIVSIIKIILGLLLIGERKRIVDFINRNENIE